MHSLLSKTYVYILFTMILITPSLLVDLFIENRGIFVDIVSWGIFHLDGWFKSFIHELLYKMNETLNIVITKYIKFY